MDDNILELVKDLIDTKIKLANIEFKVEALKRLVEVEEITRVTKDIKYDVGCKGKRVTGDLNTKDIRDIFGWTITPEALDIVKKYNEGIITKEDLE